MRQAPCGVRLQRACSAQRSKRPRTRNAQARFRLRFSAPARCRSRPTSWACWWRCRARPAPGGEARPRRSTWRWERREGCAIAPGDASCARHGQRCVAPRRTRASLCCGSRAQVAATQAQAAWCRESLNLWRLACAAPPSAHAQRASMLRDSIIRLFVCAPRAPRSRSACPRRVPRGGASSAGGCALATRPAALRS